MSAPITERHPSLGEAPDPPRPSRRLGRRVVPAVLGLVALALLA